MNKSGIEKTTGLGTTQILAFADTAVSVSAVFGNSGIVADSDGKKIIKAGTPMTGDLTARTTAFTVAATASTKIGATDEGTPVDVKTDVSNAVGISLYDIDVTSGNANATILIGGYVDLNKVDSTTAALITAPVKSALNRVTFIK